MEIVRFNLERAALDELANQGDMAIDAEPEPCNSGTDDAGLMSAIRERQADALRTLYERHAPRLCALALRIVGDRAEAEQVLTDAFWQIWEHADRYDPTRAAPITYLTLITRSRALDCRRKAKPAARLVAVGDSEKLNELEGSVASEELPPLNHLLAGERSERLRDALLSLDEDERSLIEACYYDGQSPRELAESLSQPLGTVKTRIRRGLARLRTRLARVFDEFPSQPLRADGERERR
jgi:RNA polymerase sigma-70 factor (ECF subfamily)